LETKNFPFGDRPCKPGDIIRVRDKNYMVQQLEPLFIITTHKQISTGTQHRIAEVIPSPNRIYYFTYIISENPRVSINFQRPEGQPHVYSDAVLQYLPGTILMQGINIRFTTIPAESFVVSFQSTMTTRTRIMFFGYKIIVRDTSDNLEPNVKLEDFIEIK